MISSFVNKGNRLHSKPYIHRPCHNHKSSAVWPTDLRFCEDFPWFINCFVKVHSSCLVRQPVAFYNTAAYIISMNGLRMHPFTVCQSDAWMDSHWIWQTDGSLPKEQLIKLGWWSLSGISCTRWSSVFYEADREGNSKPPDSKQIFWWKKRKENA